jgi:hypothetical protein
MLDVVGVWLIAVPLAFLGGLVLRLPVEQVVMLIAMKRSLKRHWATSVSVPASGSTVWSIHLYPGTLCRRTNWKQPSRLISSDLVWISGLRDGPGFRPAGG